MTVVQVKKGKNLFDRVLVEQRFRSQGLREHHTNTTPTAQIDKHEHRDTRTVVKDSCLFILTLR